MDLDWEEYHRFNVILLSSIGLWPYGNKFVLLLQRFVGVFFTTLCLFANLGTFVTMNYTRRLLLENGPSILVGCGMFIKYMACLAARDCIKKVTETINCDWKNLSSKEEIRIIKKYVERGKFHTKSFAILICLTAMCITVVPLAPVFLDIVIPLNESRSRSFPIMFETFLDQQKYYFANTFLFEGVIITGAIVFVSTESLLIVYAQHACSLFEVTSCRIKKMCPTGSWDSRRSSNLMTIAQVAEIHSRAIRHCNTIRNTFLRTYLPFLGFGILSLSSHLFRFTQKIGSDELVGFLTSGMFSLAIFSLIFYINFTLQGILDSSDHILYDLYASKWYELPTAARKLVNFCMLHSAKPPPTDLFGIIVPSYEGFSLMVKMTLTYATALYSLQ